MGDIGKTIRKIELEPLENPREPAPAEPAPAVPQAEPVPA